MKVLNFGSLNIDYVYKLTHIVEKGETISSQSLHQYPGGKGLNQSVALGKAGVQVFHAGAVGPEGAFLVEFLSKAGVDTGLIRVLPDEKTGHAIIQNDASGENCIILYGGANRCITEEQIRQTLDPFGAGDFLILQNEINGLRTIVETARKKGLTIVLNPSPMDETVFRLPLESIDYFILNQIEAAQLLGTDCQGAEDLLSGLSGRFPSAKIVLTLGSAGSGYTDGQHSYAQKSYSVPVVDTTAAGDTYTGYFLAGLIRGFSVPEAMDLAAKAAAVTVSRPGAGVAIPTWEEVTHKILT